MKSTEININEPYSGFFKENEDNFKKDAKAKKWNILNSIDGVDLKVGDKVTLTNDYGVVFRGMTVLGFCEKTSFGGCVYLNADCYWYPFKSELLTKEPQ